MRTHLTDAEWALLVKAVELAWKTPHYGQWVTRMRNSEFRFSFVMRAAKTLGHSQVTPAFHAYLRKLGKTIFGGGVSSALHTRLDCETLPPPPETLVMVLRRCVNQ